MIPLQAWQDARTVRDRNITCSRAPLEAEGVEASSVLLVSKPYGQRRAYATARELWSGVEFVCTSAPMELPEYVDDSATADS